MPEPSAAPSETAGPAPDAPPSPPTTDKNAPATALQGSRDFRPALISTILGTFTIFGLGFVSGIFSARFLGPEARGELTTYLLYPVLFGQIGLLGIQYAVAFEVSRRPKDQPDIMVSSVLLALLIGLPLAGIGWLVLPAMLPDDKASMLLLTRLFMLDMVLIIVWNVLQSAKQGAFQFRRYNIVRILPPLSYAVGMIGLYYADYAGASTFAISLVVGHILGIVAGVVLSWPEMSGGRVRWKEINSLVHLGIDFYKPQILDVIAQRTDGWLVVLFLSNADVGLYSVALALAQVQRAVSFSFITVGFVKVAGEVDRDAARSSFLYQFRLSQMAMAITSLGLLAAAWPLLRFGFGPEYMDAYAATCWLIVGVNLASLNRVVDNGLRALGYAWAGAVANAVLLALMVVGGFLWVLEGGILAMAWVVLGSAAAGLFISLALLWYKEPLSIGSMFGLTPSVAKHLVKSLLKRHKAA